MAETPPHDGPGAASHRLVAPGRRTRMPGRHLPRGLLAGSLVAIAVMLPVQPAAGAIEPAVTLDGPSEGIVGFGGVAMAEDGTGGVVYLKRVDGVAHVFVSRYVGGQWQTPIRVDTEEPYAASWPRIGAAEGGELVVVWATPFRHRDTTGRSTSCSAPRWAPGSSTFGPSDRHRPRHPRRHRHEPGARDELDRSGRRRLPGRATSNRARSRASRCCAPATWSRKCASRTSTASAGRRSARSTAIPASRCVRPRSPTRRRSRSARPATAWSSGRSPTSKASRASGPGASSGARSDYVLPVSADEFRRDPDRGRRRRAQRRPLAAGPGGRGLPPGRRPRLATARTAHLPEHAPRRGIASQRRGVPRRRASPTPRCSGGTRGDGRCRRASTSTKSATSACSTTATARRASSRATIAGCPAPSRWDRRSPDRRLRGERHEPRRRRGLGLAERRPAGSPAVAVREDFPGGAVQTRSGERWRRRRIGELAVGRSGLGDGLVAFQQGPLGNAAIVAAQVTAPPAALVLSTPNSWVKPAQAVVSGNRPSARTDR